MDQKASGLQGPLHRSGRAARTLGVSKDTLRKIRERGEIDAFRTPGGHFRYDVASYLLRSRAQPQPAV